MENNKIRLFRFMSKKEFDKYNKGETLKNIREWGKEGYKTTSMGFTFFSTEDKSPEEALCFLTGIVDLEMVAVFETDRENVQESVGRYTDTSKEPDIKAGATELELIDAILTMLMAPPTGIYLREYCTTKYSKKKFKLIRIGKVADAFFERKIEWTEVEDV